jgi:hypothetical protein
LDKDGVSQHYKQLFQFFVLSFDLRRVHGSKFANVSVIEEAMMTSFLALVLKLNETQLRAIFLKLLEWLGPPPVFAHLDDFAITSSSSSSSSSSSDKSDFKIDDEAEEKQDDEGDEDDEKEKKNKKNKSKKEETNHKASKKRKSPTLSSSSPSASSSTDSDSVDKAIIFFRMMSALSQQLKSIFVPYFGHVIDHAVGYLQVEPEQQQDSTQEVCLFSFFLFFSFLLFFVSCFLAFLLFLFSPVDVVSLFSSSFSSLLLCCSHHRKSAASILPPLPKLFPLLLLPLVASSSVPPGSCAR